MSIIYTSLQGVLKIRSSETKSIAKGYLQYNATYAKLKPIITVLYYLYRKINI